MNQADTGKFIADCRKEKGLTQAQLAEKLNITDRAVSKWETGKNMPDSSVMLELCQILDISVNELLCGDRIEMENRSHKAEETLLELKRKNENNIRMNTILSAIFTVVMVLGILVCSICDIAITGSLTWSRITLSAIFFTWIVSFPIILLGKKGFFWSVLSCSIFIIPFLYLLSILLESAAVFRIGAIMSILAMIYTWAAYVLFHVLQKRRMLATGIALFLGVPFLFLVNAALSKMIDEPIVDVWDLMSAFILLVMAFSFLVVDYAHNKGLVRR